MNRSFVSRIFSRLDKDFTYTREIEIGKSPAQVFAYVKSLENFKNWNPFLLKDPNTEIELRGKDGGPGFVMSWKGNKEVGSGEQEITKVVDGQRVEFELRMKTPFAATNKASFEVLPLGTSKSVVRWQMSGTSTFPMNIIGLVINFDKMVGGEFEVGLKKLKEILES